MKAKTISVAVIGCGERSRIYSDLMMRHKGRFKIVAGADPVPERVEAIRKTSGNPGFVGFTSAEALLGKGRLADMAIIGTQDAYHYEPCRKAMELGYDVLLEKPISNNLGEVLSLGAIAEQHNRKGMVCFVLRYTPFYRKVKALIDSGVIGEVVTFAAQEGVEAWHQGHSFVRGHWSVCEKSSPMIVAKCCHDMDIIHWLLGKRCKKMSSYGSLNYFTADNAPNGAPARCTDGCPADKTCMYNAKRYAGDKRFPWLPQIFDHAHTATEQEILKWLKKSPWGRCVYRCDNTAVDHQSLSMEFEGGVTGVFTMTAFDLGRHIEIYGTKGRIKGGEFHKKYTGKDIWVETHDGKAMSYNIDDIPAGGNDAHGGGDAGIIEALYNEMTAPRISDGSSSLNSSVHSHLMAFAAEESRLRKEMIDIDEFKSEVLTGFNSPAREIMMA